MRNSKRQWSAVSGLVTLSILLVVTLPVKADDEGGSGRLDPEAGRAFYEGNALLVEGRPADALSAFDRALGISPDFYRVHLYRSRAFVSLGDAEGAQSALMQFEASATTDAERQEAAEQSKLIEALVAEQTEVEAETSGGTAAGEEHEDVTGNEPEEGEEPADIAQGELDQETSSATAAEEDAVTETLETDSAPASSSPETEGVSVEPAPAAFVARPPAVRVGLQGGYALTRGDSTYHWGTLQARFEALLGKGFYARIQGGLGMQRDEDVVYFVVPAAAGLTWRAPIQPCPYLDAHVLMVFYNDGKGADGTEVSGATQTPGLGGGGGGGIEIDLLQTNGVSLSLAPEVHVGWAGLFVFQGGVSVRLAPMRSSGG